MTLAGRARTLAYYSGDQLDLDRGGLHPLQKRSQVVAGAEFDAVQRRPGCRSPRGAPRWGQGWGGRLIQDPHVEVGGSGMIAHRAGAGHHLIKNA